MNFLNLKPETFGLDISDLSFKIIKLKKKRKFLSLNSWGETLINQDIIKEGEIKDKEAFIQILKKALTNIKGARLKTNNVVVSLPENKSFSTVIQMPKMEEAELKSAVSFEAENYIPLPIEEVYLDFQIVPPIVNHLDHIDVLLTAFPKEIIDVYLSCLKKAGLVVRALESESQSIIRALVRNNLSPFPILIVDFGRSTTNFIIFSGYSIRFSSCVCISSFQFNEAISRSLKVSIEEAERLKIKYGLPAAPSAFKEKIETKTKNTITKKDIFEAMIPVLSDLTGQIKKHLNFYQTHSSHEHLSDKSGKVKKIILCGRAANLKGLTDFLSFSLKIPVELGNPWINILPEPLKEVPELPFEESLGYTTALGLALRGIREQF